MKKRDGENTTEAILVISTGFLALGLIFNLKLLLLVALSIGLVGIFSTYLSSKITWLWFKLAKIMEYIVPNILLSIVFYFVLLPLSFLSKIFNKDPLLLSKKHPSYFTSTKKNFSKEDFKKMW